MLEIFEIDFYQKENGTVPVEDLHGFIKKTMKTPQGELERARKYMEDYKRRAEYE